MSALNENIKKFREMRRMNQRILAERLNKSRAVISNWERGENSPDADTVEQICKILNVTPNMLYGWDRCPDYEKYSDQLNKLVDQENQISEEIERLNGKLLKIKSERRKMMLEDVRSLLDLPPEEEEETFMPDFNRLIDRSDK